MQSYEYNFLSLAKYQISSTPPVQLFMQAAMQNTTLATACHWQAGTILLVNIEF